MPQSDRRAPHYTRHMDADAAAEFDAAPADGDLAAEIRLLRSLIGRLGADMDANAALIARVMVVLCRVLGMQARQGDTGADLRRELEEAGERVLRMRQEEE